jgi:uncharacterized integral membrane protein (TIGR00698 family)
MSNKDPKPLMNPGDTLSKMTPLEKGLLGVSINNLPKLTPGILAVVILTWVSISLSEFIGLQLMGFEKSPVSPVMLAIILGMLIGVVIQIPKAFGSGINFAVKKILKLGIILLGIRLTVFDVLRLGGFGIPIVAACILGALFFTTWINKRLKLPERLGTLIAVGTSICGVTAIVATSPAIGAEEEEATYAVATITVFGLFATIFYPYLAHFIFDAESVLAGLFLGTSVHETAQVVGAGKIYADIFSQPITLDVATVSKLVRNFFMLGVIPVMAYAYSQKNQNESREDKFRVVEFFPIFILGFLAMAVLRSIGDAGINAGGNAYGIWLSDTWKAVISSIKQWAEIFLVAALAGVGLNTKFKSLKVLGLKPFIVGLGASLSVGIISYISISILGRWVSF